MAISIELSFQQVTGSDSAPLVGVRDWTEFSEGKRGKRIGSTYEILLLNNSCEKLRIHVEESESIISQEEIDKRAQSLNFCMIRCDGFKGRPYSDKNGRLAISASATKVTLVNTGTGVAKA